MVTGRPPVLTSPEEKQTSHIFRTRDSFANWSKASTEVRLLASPGTGRLGHYLSKCVYFKRWLSGPGGNGLGVRLFSHYKDRPIFEKDTERNFERKRQWELGVLPYFLSLFRQGELSLFCSICLCLYTTQL